LDYVTQTKDGTIGLNFQSYRKNHVVQLPYESNFNEKTISTKARPIQMNQELLEYCKKEIQDLLQK
jgi:hypothetical protein